MPDEELEISEREKYNYFVTEKEYGKDFKREKQINKITNHLGEVSKGFLNTLEELKQKDIFKVLDIGSGPGGVMNWFKEEHGSDVYGIDISDAFDLNQYCTNSFSAFVPNPINSLIKLLGSF